MNFNIPHFRALVRESWFTKNEQDKHNWYEVICFAVQSISGKILTFHVLADNGAMRSRVPISEVYTKVPTTPDIPFHYHQLWDMFSENAHVVTYDFLKYHKCQITLKDRTYIEATYMFTIDWFDNSYSDEPQDYKCGHLLAGDDGRLYLMPNNRLLWRDSNWVTNKDIQKLSKWKVDTSFLSVEVMGDRWVSADTDCFFYDIDTNIEKELI
jgi:hypothetical protein